MARKTIEQRLAELDAQRATLKARLSKQERANDTRRKVLLGALVLHRLESSNDPDFTRRLSDWLRRELPDFLTRDGDKELFADLLKEQAGGEPGAS
jgi:anti-anti-sigma regulatory factor